jgi:hypothetical protein
LVATVYFRRNDGAKGYGHGWRQVPVQGASRRKHWLTFVSGRLTTRSSLLRNGVQATGAHAAVSMVSVE